MNIRKIPALVLATALQIVPMSRVACINQAVAPNGFAVVMRWVSATVALLGSFHAVSGASASIQGVAAWTKITNGMQAGPVVSAETAPAGQPVLYKIIVQTPATQNAQDDYYYYDILPPGLTMNTNVGGADGLGNGFISGTPTQAGVYNVTITAGNTLWPQTTNKVITLTITGGGATPPSITSPPVSQTVTAGTNVTFTVVANGTAPLSYSWKFNNAAISGATAASLQLTNVQTTNSGTYTVTVTNTAGSQSASATLTVNAAVTAPTITTQPKSLTVTNGDAASLTVVASGTGLLSYRWFKGTSIIPTATNATYTIGAATTNDAGAYTVVVTNSAGSITSSVATLTVLWGPIIVTPPQALTVSNGTKATFTVTADGTGPLTYLWNFNGAAMLGETSSTLTITNAQGTNQGDYTVTVSNPVGSITSPAAHLTVQSGVSAPLKLANLALSSGSLSFDVTGPSQTNIVIWRSLDLTKWSALRTNASAGGTVHFTDTNGTAAAAFYRATLSP